MTNINEIKPATKAQIAALIELCKELELYNAAGYLQLASDELDEAANGKKDCSCFMYMGDNPDCPVHGGMFKNTSSEYSMCPKCNHNGGRHYDESFSMCPRCGAELIPPSSNHGAFSEAEIKADYQERNDLYMMGIGA